MTKDELELEQLGLDVELKKVELQEARRPFLKRFTTWLSAISTLVTLVTGTQWYGTAKEKDKAEAAVVQTATGLAQANDTIRQARMETQRNAERFAVIEQKIAAAKQALDQPGRPVTAEAARAKEHLAVAETAAVELRAGFSNRLMTLEPVSLNPEAARVIEKATPRRRSATLPPTRVAPPGP